MTGVAGISLLDSPRQLWDAERRFNHHDKSGPPALGVSLSGGGNRAASFGIGVLAALHERRLLSKVDVISAVSGGSYALSWLLLQPYYYSAYIDSAVGLLDVQSKMFDPEGGFQRYLEDNARLGTHDPVTRPRISISSRPNSEPIVRSDMRSGGTFRPSFSWRPPPVWRRHCAAHPAVFLRSE